MQTMKAACIHSFDGIEKIAIEGIAVPNCGEDEVLIQVKYAGINPVDWKIAEGLLKSRMAFEFPIILGWDVSGIISTVGKNVKHLKVGDSVFAYCRKEKIKDGAFAEYICLNGTNVVLKPKTLSFAEAACVPLSALTAWQAIHDIIKLKKGEKILIHAGAGGVGGFAIQFAKLVQAYVITTASQINSEYVTNFGADEIIDYTKESFVEAILKRYPEGFDAAFDTVGNDALKSTYEIMKKNGRLVSIAGVIDQAMASEKQISAEYMFVRPDAEELATIGNLIDAQKLKIPRIQEIPFDQIISALRKSRERHVQGKLVLKIS